MTHRNRTSMRVVFTLMCVAVLVTMPVAQSAARTRLAQQQSTKDIDSARLVELNTSIHTMKERLAVDPTNTRLQSKYNAAVAEYNAISARLGGDQAATVPIIDSTGRPLGNGFPAPPNCTATTQTVTNSTPVAIPDNTTVMSSINVSTPDTWLLTYTVQTNITHTFAADLDIFLTDPSGETITLTTDNGGGNDNVFNGTVWDDKGGAANPPGAVTDNVFANLVVESPLVPEEALNVAHASNPNGTWTLSISDDATGDTGTLSSWSITLVTLPAGPSDSAVAATNLTPVTIVDNATVMSTINIATPGTYINDVNVTTNITHTFNSDLTVTLTSPAGTVTTLTSNNGGSNDNVFNGTQWNDTAGIPFPPGPVTDTVFANNVVQTVLVPEEAMAAFVNENPNGTWTLSVNDNATGDVGAFTWGLDILTTQCQVGGGTCSLTCPADQVVMATDATGAVVNYPAPTDNGNCGPATCVPPSGSQFPVGTTTVTCTAPDNVPSDPSGTVTTVYSSGNIAVPIPDNNPSGGSVMINVPDTGAVTDVNVRLRLNHTFDSDLAIGLSHASSSNALSNNNGGSGDNYGSGNNDCSGTPTVFDDQGVTPISSGAAPFAGTFIPQSGLGIHNGSDASGIWTLTTVDSVNLDSGTIGCVELEITRDVTGGGGGGTCSFNVTVSIPFDSCCVDDGTGDTFSQVVASVPPTSPLYGFWQYQVAATNEVFTGTANIVSYRPGLSIVMDDNVTVNYGMHAEIDFPRKKCRVRVVERPTNRQFVLRDRDITNNMCAPAPPPPPPVVIKNQ